MNPSGNLPTDDPAAEASLRAELARGRQSLGAIASVLSHLVGDASPVLFSEEIVARTRGMVESVAAALLRRCNDDALLAHAPALSAELAGQAALLAHCHALALEGTLAARLAETGLDPVLSPLLQEWIAGAEPDIASLAMTLLAAQARFVQAQRRMEVALEELPADLLHDLLPALDRTAQEAGVTASARIRASLDEGRSRTALMAQLLLATDGGLAQALDLDRAGVAMFLSALSLSTGVDRSSVVLSTSDGQQARLALMLAACGVDRAGREAVLARLAPDSAAPALALAMASDRARELLAEEAGR